MPENGSLDPLQTVDHAPSPEPAAATVDGTGPYEPAGTEPHVPAPPADAPDVPGYRIRAEIATGGMGRVYAGLDLTLDREVAIKTLLPGADGERFVTEARIAARLAHPGIPPVHELGTLPDGAPFLAMKLIRGRTLAELLAERPTPLHDLPRFVGVFEQIAQAVGFAHAQGVIHRDLKPLNVMVGSFGEVQVMDWGLAKDLTQPGSPDRPIGEALTKEYGFALTVAGAIMGTPGYMAPEQARGEPVDARADVFALGAILAAILTGQPAVVGTNRREVIDRAAQADLADVRDRLTASGADGELIALAVRCLAADAADRPAGGQAVAAEVAAYRAGVEARLRRAETERAEALVREAEQRKRRRTVQIAAGAIAAVLLTGLSVSLWQMFRAIAAEGKAVEEREAKETALQDEIKARQQAFAALRSMTTEVIERKFAQGTTLTDEDRAFLRNVIAQYDAFAAIKGDDADSRAIRAEGRKRVGVIRYKLGELQLAEQDYDQALSIQTQLAADFPTRPEFRRQLAGIHNSRVVLLCATGRLKEAEQHCDQALTIYKQLAADFPNRPEFRQELASSHNNRGMLLSDTGQLKEAEQHYDQALSLDKQLAADFPTRPDFRHSLAMSHTNRGRLLRDTGRPKEAERDYDQAVRIQTQLAADFPTRPEFRRELAGSHSVWGNLLSDLGQVKEAEFHYDHALNVFKKLAADFPVLPDFRYELAGSHLNRGSWLFDMRQVKEAEYHYDSALSVLKQLTIDFPTRTAFRQTLALVYDLRGIVLSVTGRFTEAGRDYDQALNLRKQLVADSPAEPDLRNHLAGTYVNLAILQGEQQRKWGPAKRLLEVGRPHHLAALQANPQHLVYRQFYSNHLVALIKVHAGLLEQDDAAQTADARRDLGWNPAVDAYDAAWMLSKCIPIVTKHDALDNPQRKAAERFYGDAAMKMLQDAVRKGYKDVTRMKKDTAFSPLRQRDDFKKLVAELEAKAK